MEDKEKQSILENMIKGYEQAQYAADLNSKLKLAADNNAAIAILKTELDLLLNKTGG